MTILCTICTNLVKPSENLEATTCGHLFHNQCLAEWIKRSETCPQCRKGLRANCIFRIYPTLQNEDSSENIATLQSKLDDALLELQLQKATIKDLEAKLKKATEENEKLLKKNGESPASSSQETVNPSSQNSAGQISTSEVQARDEVNRPEVQARDEFNRPEAQNREENRPEAQNRETGALTPGLQNANNASSAGNFSLAINSAPARNIPSASVALLASNSPPASNSSPVRNPLSARNSSSARNSTLTRNPSTASNSSSSSTSSSAINLLSASNLSSANRSPTSTSSSANNASASNDFVCHNCGRICGSRIGLYSHEQSCLRNNSTNLSIGLSPRAPSIKDSWSQQASSSNSGHFACKNCGRVCGSQIGLYSHKQSCIRKNLTNIPVEPVSTWSTFESDRSHQASSSSNSGHFPCPICGRVCGSRIGLYSHEQSCRKKNSLNAGFRFDDRNSRNIDEDRFFMNLPIEPVSTRSTFESDRSHQASSSSNSGHFPCPICGRVCGSRIGLYSHEQSCRENNSLNAGFGFDDRNSRNIDEDRFISNFMHKSRNPVFSIQESRPRQQQTSSRTGDFPCYNCGRVCRSQIGLYSHQRSCLNK